jgi:lysozyme
MGRKASRKCILLSHLPVISKRFAVIKILNQQASWQVCVFLTILSFCYEGKLVKRYLLTILSLSIILSACELETKRLHAYEVHGIDVSHHQSYINWDSVALEGIDFAFVKATEGMTFRDSLFEHNWSQIKSNSIKRGAYHFYRPAVSAHAQAEHFKNQVHLGEGDLPPVLDVEVIDGVSRVKLLTGILNWLYLVEIHYGVRPILYTNLKFYNKYLAGHFDEYPLWIARYNTRQPTLACGREWQFWQYGNRGQLSGVNGDVDFNVFHGSWSQLDSLCYYTPPVLSRVD